MDPRCFRWRIPAGAARVGCVAIRGSKRTFCPYCANASVPRLLIEWPDDSGRLDYETPLHRGMVFAEISAIAVRWHDYDFAFSARDVCCRPTSIDCRRGM